MINYAKELNSSQREAVLYDDGPALVIAGAGSGKTRVLTYKLAHLIEQGYKPWRLMALTFTNKAANEMKNRVQSLVGSNDAQRMMVGTFHSVFARILRNFAHLLGYNRNFTIYDTADSKALVKSILKKLDIDAKAYVPNAILATISDAKNHLISPEAYAADSMRRRMDNFNGRPKLYEIYALYCKECKRANAMDFDDLLYQFNVLLRDFPDACDACQNAIDYLLIDEYQDTNASQYYIARKLVEKTNKIFVVGDDSQSIYAFRGAKIENILLFTKNFVGARVFKLEQNYRSTQNIVNLANGLIRYNKHGIPKTLYSKRHIGKKTVINEYSTGREEAASIIQDIYSMVQANTTLTYNSFAILYRTNAQSRLFEEQLKQRNIFYRIYGGMSFYARAEIKNILAYLRFLANPNDNEAFMRIMGYPKKGIGDKTQAILASIATERDTSLYEATIISVQEDKWLKGGAKRKVNVFLEMLDELKHINCGTLFDATKEILKISRIDDDLRIDNTIEGIARRDNIKEFLNSIKDYQDEYEPNIGANNNEQPTEPDIRGVIAQYIEGVSLITSQENDQNTSNTDKVTLLTVHAAKGLEFEHIYITGMEEGVFPSLQSSFGNDLEEERRLFYVAITRAKELCTISLARTRMRNGNNDFMLPSSFIKELDKELIEFHSDRMPWEISSMPHSNTSDLYENNMLPKFDSSSPLEAYDGLELFTDIQQEESKTSFEKPSNKTTKTINNSIFSIGQKVQHNQFGIGIVRNIEGTGNDTKVVVEFNDGNIKTIFTRFSKLVPL